MNKALSLSKSKPIRLVSFFAACMLILAFSGKQYTSANHRPKTFVISPTTGDTLFHMCDVMTGPEVAALSPFGQPIKSIQSDVAEYYTVCHYDFISKDDYPQIHIVLTVSATADEAKTAYRSSADSWREMYEREPENIANLADSACFMGNADPQWCDDCGLQAWVGRYFITIGFKGYYQNKITARQKQESAVALLKLLFQKKPYLKQR